jgi:basic amino acid/polyamine antiporter, APA family
MSGKDNLTTELSRELSLFQITAMGLGMMIGAGVFLGMGNTIREAGPGGVILTFSLNMLLALFTAMSYAELSSAIPKAGGAYNFARIGFGRKPSFIAGWMEWFASSIAGSMYALTFSEYTLKFLHKIGYADWIPPEIMGMNGIEFSVKIFAVLIALLFIYINYRGVSETGSIGVIITVAQTLFMIFIGVFGIIVAINEPDRLQNFHPFLPMGWPKILITMGFTFVAFEGYELIAQAGDEAIEPRKNLPKAMLYSVLIVGITYVAVAFANVIAVKPGTVDGPVWEWIGSFGQLGFREAISRLIPFGNVLLTLAVIFASTSALNATVFSATRASYALGRDKMLPNIFSKISPKRKTPWGALLMTAFIILFVIFLPTLDVLSSASMMFLFLFFLVNVCVIKIRYNMGEELTYGFLMPLFPLFPILAIICQPILAIELRHVSPVAWIIAIVWVVSGFIIYSLYSKSRITVTEDEIQVLEEDAAPPGDEYRVMVPIANPDNALSLVGNTIKLCKNRDSRIKLLHMVAVPDQMSLTDASMYTLEGQESIMEAMLYLKPRFPITTTIRYCRNIARGIINAVKEKKIQLLIMGWHGMKKKPLFKIGSTLDPVIARAPCDIIVLKDCANKKFNKVLVPLFGTDNDGFALETASEFSENITVLAINNTLNGKYVESIIKKSDLNIAPKVWGAANGDIANEVLAASKDFDLVVLGIKEMHMHRFHRETPEEIIAQKCEKPLALVKVSKGLISWAKRII